MTDFRTRRITANLPGVEGSLTSGQTLQNRYLIMGVLGVGGMGSVYQARDLHFPNVTKLVAVKEMMNLAPDPALREMIVRNFEREANLLATLSHPSIPKIYDLFSHKDRSYLVMEYIAGKDLEAVLAETEGFLPETQVVEWALQLCDVLTYLHSHQPDPIVFRDMKPSNVMIDERKKVRLIDFGIARGFQAGQRGTGVQTVAPNSISAWLKSPAWPRTSNAGASFQARVRAEPDRSRQPSRRQSTRATLPSTTGASRLSAMDPTAPAV